MATQPLTKTFGISLRRADAWVWPLTAAIVMGGSILFWSLAGLFWLAARPSQPPIVIRMAPAELRSDVGYELEYDSEQHSAHVVAETIR
jgi:hypothetical protein